MKKILIVSSLLVLIMLIAGLFIFIKSNPEQTIVAGQKEAEWATQELLKRRAAKSLDTLVMGTAIEPGEWDFRGVARQGESGLPIYGVVKLKCPKPTKELRCWTLQTLNRDGRDWRLDVNVAEVRNKSKKLINNTKDKSTKKLSQPAVKQEDKQPAQQKPLPPQSIWVVKGRSINGRKGPGTTFDITTKINPEINLQLIKQQKGWGQFRILPPSNNAEKTVWIWLDLAVKKPN